MNKKERFFRYGVGAPNRSRNDRLDRAAARTAEIYEIEEDDTEDADFLGHERSTPSNDT